MGLQSTEAQWPAVSTGIAAPRVAQQAVGPVVSGGDALPAVKLHTAPHSEMSPRTPVGGQDRSSCVSAVAQAATSVSRHNLFPAAPAEAICAQAAGGVGSYLGVPSLFPAVSLGRKNLIHCQCQAYASHITLCNCSWQPLKSHRALWLQTGSYWSRWMRISLRVNYQGASRPRR